MKRHTKIFLLFSLLLLIVITIKLTKEYNDTEQLKNMIVEDESKSLSALVVAFRKTYQKRFVQNHITIDNKSVDLLPVRTMGEISENFSSLVGGRAIIRTVSDRPRNPINKANAEEMKMIEYFNANKSETSYFKDMGSGIFYYAQPLYIQKGCLKCHGKREDAIELIKTNYTMAYDYKIGDIRGILSIKIDKSNIVNKIADNYNRGVQAAFVVFSLFLSAIYLMMKIILKNQRAYEETLEDKVQEQLAELKKKEKKMFEQSKLASMGEMIGNIAHQWRQPLSVISTAATGMLLQKKVNALSDDEFENTCNRINENAQFLSQTIDDFRNFIKGDKQPVKFNLKNDTDSFIKLVDSTIKNEEIEVILSLEEHINIKGYPNELIQCFMNIFNNSKDAFNENNIDKNDRFVFITQKIDEDTIIITFKDTANGIPEHVLEKIFEPYFTTKHQSQGTGLGLHMSYNLIVNQMKGSIKATNEQFEFNGKTYKGAMFTIAIPLDKQSFR
jgi:signal transduction histidine kinase